VPCTFHPTKSVKRLELHALSTIVAQLSQNLQKIPPEVLSLYNSNYLQPTVSTLEVILKLLVPEFKRLFIVVDIPEDSSTLRLIKSLWNIDLVESTFAFNVLVLTRRIDSFPKMLLRLGSKAVSNGNPIAPRVVDVQRIAVWRPIFGGLFFLT